MTEFSRRLWLIFALLWLQRAIRLSLRAAWLLAGGILAGWGIHRLWGWQPEPGYWLLLGAVPAGLSLLAIVLPLPQPGRVAWRLDRLYGFDEQVSTAWQIRQQPQNEIASLLAADAAALLPRVRRRLLWRGWYLLGDLVSVLIIGVLCALALGPSSTAAPAEPLQAEQARLPLAGRDATAGEVFPGGIPGLPPQDVGGSPAALGQGNSDNISTSGGEGTRSEAGDAILRELGGALAQEAATYATGQALQEGNLAAAATQMELMGDQLESLDPEAQRAAGEEMTRAGEELASAGSASEQQLAESLQELGQSMVQGEAPPQEQLDAVAASLRELADLPIVAASTTGTGGNGDGAGTGGASTALGDPQPLERLTGEGETLPVETGAAGEGVMLQGEPGEQGEQAVGGAVDRTAGSTTTGRGVLAPYQFPWRWRHVVADYFTPP